MTISATESGVVIAACWGLGLLALYWWGAKPGSALLRLDGGQVRTTGNLFGLIVFYSVAAGVVLAVTTHDWMYALVYGPCAGGAASQVVIHGIARGRNAAVGASRPSAGTGSVGRFLLLLYVAFCVGAAGSCLWLYYAVRPPGWIPAAAGGSALVLFSALVWARWISWKGKHRDRG